MKTLESINVIEENIITETEETLEEQLIYLFVARDETLAMISEFGDEEYLIEKLQKIEEEIEKLKKIINSNQ